MATPDPTRRPPAVGRTLSVKVDADLYADLLTLLGTGVTTSDAVRDAVRLAAGIHRTAWANRVVPPGTPPVITSYTLQRAPGWTPPTSGYDPSHGPTHAPITPPTTVRPDPTR
jgi:hypothetical protein